MSKSQSGHSKDVRKRKTAKSVVRPPKVVSGESKIRKKPQYKSFRLHKRIRYPGPSLPSSLGIGSRALRLMLANVRPLIWFVVVYGVLSLVFVSGVVSPINIEEVRSRLQEQTGQASSFAGNITILGIMLGSAFRASGEVSAMYQSIFLVTSSLALIWLYRQQQAGSRVSLKDAYYRGMYPLVPFIGVLCFMGLQLLPVAAGNLVYGAVIRGGLAVTFAEQLAIFLLFVLCILLSLYLVVTSFIALFVVTLPEMSPLGALREAKTLVMYRRHSVLLRILALLLFVIIAYVVIVLPAIFVSAALSQVFFFLLTILILPFIIAYMFVLYRELLSTAV